MKFFRALQRFTDGVPLWVYNLVTLVSGGATIVSFGYGVYLFFFGGGTSTGQTPIAACLITLTAVITAVVVAVRYCKIRKLAIPIIGHC